MTLRVDSAGIQAADMLDWYRPLSAWRLRRHSCRTIFHRGRDVSWLAASLHDAAFPVPAAAGPFQFSHAALVSRAMRGGIQMRKWWLSHCTKRSCGHKCFYARKDPTRFRPSVKHQRGRSNLSFLYDFRTRSPGDPSHRGSGHASRIFSRLPTRLVEKFKMVGN